jgi:trans-2,3-dihydro-3-hydroxyanthranilate isomerase
LETAVQVQFVTVDVFTDRQFGGNPLAVVLDARGLATAQMQAIASEFNLAETTFVLPPKDPRNTAHVRIFTPKAEMPFAGHPNVGTAFVLARLGHVCGQPIGGFALAFEEIAGLVNLELIGQGAATTGARLSAPQPLTIADQVEPDLVAKACGISTSDIEMRNHAPCVASCGARFLFAEVNSRKALAAAQHNAAIFSSHLAREYATGVHLYMPTSDDVVDIQSRMFAPLHGIPEDPATGSANVALIGLLAHLAPEKNLTVSKRIGQGFDMGRPSIMNVEAVKQDGNVVKTFIGGQCVEVTQGTLVLR